MKKNRVSLLLLTCGTNACFHIAKQLKVKFADRIRIVGSDINCPWMIPTHPYLDAFYPCPLTSSDGYYGFILDICDKEHVDYLLPSFDADQLFFHQGNEDLIKRGIVSLGITAEAAEIYQSKEDTNRFLEQHHLPVPCFYQTKDVEDNHEYFCKPRHGVGSAGVKKLTGWEIKKVSDDNLIIEEICQEPEITLECFNYKGKIYSVARERLGTKAGVCTKARVFNDKELGVIAQRFADSIKLPYIFNLQFMTNAEGQKVITDVNLRTAGGMSLSYAAGWDEVEALGKIMLGEDDVESSVRKIVQEQFVMRAYTDIVTKQVKKRICFDLDGTLLDSRKRHKKVMDYVLKQYGISIDTTNLFQYKADGNNNLSWLRSKGVEINKALEINQRWMELIEDKVFLAEDRLYSNTKSILETLSKNNYIVLLTARNKIENTESQIDDLGIRQYLDKVAIVPSCKQTAKLKADILLENSICEFYGDTESDMEAARMAECDFYVSTRGFRSKKYWSAFNVKYSDLLDKE